MILIILEIWYVILLIGFAVTLIGCLIVSIVKLVKGILHGDMLSCIYGFIGLSASLIVVDLVCRLFYK